MIIVLLQLSYAGRCLPGLKKIANCLYLLCGEKEFKPQSFHVQAFYNIQFLLSLNMGFKIPDLEKNALISVDASRFNIGGCLSEINIDEEHELVDIEMIGAVSRLLPRAQLGQSTVQKELESLILTVTNFEYLIRK